MKNIFQSLLITLFLSGCVPNSSENNPPASEVNLDSQIKIIETHVLEDIYRVSYTVHIYCIYGVKYFGNYRGEGLVKLEDPDSKNLTCSNK